MAAGYTVIGREPKPKVVKLKHWRNDFGEVEELISESLGAGRVGVATVTLTGPDILHSHANTEETYICIKGEGEIFLDEEIVRFIPGVSVIIKPGTVHAARPTSSRDSLVFSCISSPAFNSGDVINDPRGRRWEGIKEEDMPGRLSGVSASAGMIMMRLRIGIFASEKENLKISEFKGSMEFERILMVEKLLDLLERAKEVAENKDDPAFKITEKQYKAYKIIRPQFFKESIKDSDPGWEEWNTAIDKRFKERMAGIKWDKIKEGRESLKKFINNPEDATEEEIGNLEEFFGCLSVSFP
ncbi:MAG: cupin domain-containing protein [bacterium]|nr:cupin domain-containing protein [bacterium]